MQVLIFFARSTAHSTPIITIIIISHTDDYFQYTELDFLLWPCNNGLINNEWRLWQKYPEIFPPFLPFPYALTYVTILNIVNSYLKYTLVTFSVAQTTNALAFRVARSHRRWKFAIPLRDHGRSPVNSRFLACMHKSPFRNSRKREYLLLNKPKGFVSRQSS